MEAEIGIEGLGDLAIQVILSKLDPNHTAIVSCVNKKFKGWASDDFYWSNHCSRDLNISTPIDPLGSPAPSYKVAYRLWREAFIMYPWPLFKRVKRCWDSLKSWLESNFPEVLATLRKGASEEELNDVEKSLKVKLPLPTRLIYRLHDGQEYSENLLGLIGGYFVYNHLVNVNLLPLRHAVMESQSIKRDLGFSNASKFIAVASSVKGSEKVFCLNCVNNQLYVGTAMLREDGEMIPCVPDALLKSSSNQQCDGVLLWLEEHNRRLHSGMITVLEQENLKSISQFPEKPPLCSTAVTNGVQVRASAVLVPEQSELVSPKFMFAYSIRMSLLPEGCKVHGMTYDSCQLHRRRWIIRENEVVMHDVNGEAVIGKYPLLLPGEKEFVYESCSNQQRTPGSIEGSFTFVPGRLAQPKGDPFQVEVARFPLVMPDYIF
ncbi:F-box protein SKIP16-like [Chenopodium quinoa]|uniref:ApaG domain-containing protein n=1 Tax=Chenopodium quinoa TaxID=63459 RepID=A0A803KTJ0_CHEQI|nr:F-box protein SKIP16-like [Chenopodium quinoa]